MPSSFQLKSQNDMKDWYILHKLPTGASEFLIQVSDPEGFSQYCRISISIVSKFRTRSTDVCAYWLSVVVSITPQRR